MCVWLWNWTCFRLIPAIGHTFSKNRNQFCFLSSLLISLLVVPILLAPPPDASVYISHFFKLVLPPYGSPSVTFPLMHPYCTVFLSLSPLAPCPLMCLVIVSCEYPESMASPSGCHSAAWAGPQFTMSIVGQVSACQLHSWGGKSRVISMQRDSLWLSLTPGANIPHTVLHYLPYSLSLLSVSHVSSQLHFIPSSISSAHIFETSSLL